MVAVPPRRTTLSNAMTGGRFGPRPSHDRRASEPPLSRRARWAGRRRKLPCYMPFRLAGDAAEGGAPGAGRRARWQNSIVHHMFPIYTCRLQGGAAAPCYTPFMLSFDTAERDWVRHLELDGARAMADNEAGEPLRVLVLYGSLRQRSYSKLLAYEFSRSGLDNCDPSMWCLKAAVGSGDPSAACETASSAKLMQRQLQQQAHRQAMHLQDVKWQRQ